MSETDQVEIEISDEQQVQLIEMYINDNMSEITQQHIKEMFGLITIDNLLAVTFAAILNEQINTVLYETVIKSNENTDN